MDDSYGGDEIEEDGEYYDDQGEGDGEYLEDEEEGEEEDQDEYQNEEYEDHENVEEGQEEDIELVEEEQRPSVSKKAKRVQTQSLDSLFLESVREGPTKTGPQVMKSLTALLANEEHRELAKKAISDIATARQLAKSEDFPKSFQVYMQGLDHFYKLCVRGDYYTQLEQTIKFLCFDLARISKKITNDENKSAEVLLNKMRMFLAKFKSPASQAVGLALCLRIGSGAMANLKVFFDPGRMEKTSSSTVVVSYYRGRLACIEGRTKDALFHLEDSYKGISWEICKHDPHAFANKKRAFERLVPLKLITGRYPKRELLDKFNLGWRYERLIEAGKSGNLASLSQELDKQDEYFMKMECANLVRVWMMSVCKQHLFRIVAKEIELAGGTLRLSMLANLSAFYVGGTAEMTQLTEEERLNYIVCMISDLISRGMMNASISFGDQETLMLSSVGTRKSDGPFPTLSTSQVKSYKASKW